MLVWLQLKRAISYNMSHGERYNADQRLRQPYASKTLYGRILETTFTHCPTVNYKQPESCELSFVLSRIDFIHVLNKSLLIGSPKHIYTTFIARISTNIITDCLRRETDVT